MKKENTCKFCGFSKIDKNGYCENCGKHMNEDLINDMWIFTLMR